MPQLVSQVAIKNDAVRKSGRMTVTRNVMALTPDEQAQLFNAVLHYEDQFNGEPWPTDNDPYGEHDFGVVKMFDSTWYWKIDYYHGDPLDPKNPYQSMGCEPDDPACYRVMTILNSEEY